MPDFLSPRLLPRHAAAVAALGLLTSVAAAQETGAPLVLRLPVSTRALAIRAAIADSSMSIPSEPMALPASSRRGVVAVVITRVSPLVVSL